MWLCYSSHLTSWKYNTTPLVFILHWLAGMNTHILGLSGLVPSWGSFGLRAEARQGPFKPDQPTRLPTGDPFTQDTKDWHPLAKAAKSRGMTADVQMKLLDLIGDHLRLCKAHSYLFLFHIHVCLDAYLYIIFKIRIVSHNNLFNSSIVCKYFYSADIQFLSGWFEVIWSNQIWK